MNLLCYFTDKKILAIKGLAFLGSHGTLILFIVQSQLGVGVHSPQVGVGEKLKTGLQLKWAVILKL